MPRVRRHCGAAGPRSPPAGSETGATNRSNARSRLIPLSGPVPRAARLPGIAVPRAAAGISSEFARTRGKFVWNGHGCANGTGSGHVASELDEVWMRHDPIGDVNVEVIG